MLREVGEVPLPFEQVVVEVLASRLAVEGFKVKPSSPPYRNRLVTFSREREGQLERVRFGRRVYDEEAMRSYALEDEVDRAPGMPDGQKNWLSRHLLSVQILVNSGNSNLLRSGRVGTTLDEVWWDFNGEDRLRLLLRDKVLPLLLTVGMRSFDEALEDRPNADDRKRALQENVA